MEESKPRRYDNRRRSAAAARTSERIVDATERLLREAPTGAVTLQAIAEAAQVAQQTALRHFGSRDGCLAAVGVRLRERVARQRGAPGEAAAGGNAEVAARAAVREVLDHYQAEGRLMLRLLAQEEQGDPFVHQAVQEGRHYHRAWVVRRFARFLGEPPDPVTTDALVAATDLYAWKLLRLDLGRDGAATEAAMVRTVAAVLRREEPWPAS